jgi:hypothetical protein
MPIMTNVIAMISAIKGAHPEGTDPRVAELRRLDAGAKQHA